MLFVEIILGAALALLAISLIGIFRRERLRHEAGHTSPTHPFLLGVYRGLAFVLVAYVALTVLAAVLGAYFGGRAPN